MIDGITKCSVLSRSMHIGSDEGHLISCIRKVVISELLLTCRYLKSGPGNLEKDVERRFSYALSREDIENAVLGGP